MQESTVQQRTGRRRCPVPISANWWSSLTVGRCMVQHRGWWPLSLCKYSLHFIKTTNLHVILQQNYLKKLSLFKYKSCKQYNCTLAHGSFGCYSAGMGGEFLTAGLVSCGHLCVLAVCCNMAVMSTRAFSLIKLRSWAPAHHLASKYSEFDQAVLHRLPIKGQCYLQSVFVCCIVFFNTHSQER